MAVEFVHQECWLPSDINVNANLQTQETADIQDNNLAVWTADNHILNKLMYFPI